MNINITNPIFHDEAKALAHLEADRWPDGEPICPHCGSTKTIRMGGKTQAGMFLCNDCRDKFTVRTGTVMERSHIPLHKWLLATHLMAASKKGMSAKQIERMLGVTYKTAWFLCHRIREAMTPTGNTAPLGGVGGIVEVDETFVGGKQRNRAFRDVGPKKVVVSLVERGGHARSFHVANIKARDLRSMIVTNVDRSSHLMTDEAFIYTGVGREFQSHGAVNHGAKEYVRGVDHSNTAESFFSIFKRGYVGTYHHMSEAHLHRYTAEFDFRYNHRKGSDAECAAAVLKGSHCKRESAGAFGQRPARLLRAN
jgi:transposase-like protein